MRIRLEKRLTPSRFMQVATPIASVLLTMLLGAIIFQLIGFDGPRRDLPDLHHPDRRALQMAGRADQGRAAHHHRARPVARQSGQDLEHRRRRASTSSARWPARASPSLCPTRQGFWVIPLMIAAGIVGGMAWAAIPAFLKTRYRVSEVLSTLMLVYVAMQVLNYLIGGPWKDPNGHNFPQTPPFTAAAAPAPRHPRNRHSAGLRRRHRADARVLGAHDALGLRLLGAHRRRRAERRALRRLRRLAHRLVDA